MQRLRAETKFYDENFVNFVNYKDFGLCYEDFALWYEECILDYDVFFISTMKKIFFNLLHLIAQSFL